MSLPATHHLDIYRGDTFRATLTFVSAGVPLVLPTTGWAAQVRSNPDAATSVPFTVDASAGATGVIVISLAAAATVDLEQGVWDLQNTTTDVTTYITGRVSVSKDVTR